MRVAGWALRKGQIVRLSVCPAGGVAFNPRMFHVTILGSGSAGNCALVETPQTRLLDRWRPERAADRAAARAVRGESAGDRRHPAHARARRSRGRAECVVQAIFHADLLQPPDRRGAAEATAPELRKDWRLFVTGSEFTIKDITVETFPVPHDAVEPCGFVLHHGDGRARRADRSRHGDEARARARARGADAAHRDESRREAAAKRHEAAVVGEAADHVAARASLECGGGRTCSRTCSAGGCGARCSGI